MTDKTDNDPALEILSAGGVFSIGTDIQFLRTISPEDALFLDAAAETNKRSLLTYVGAAGVAGVAGAAGVAGSTQLLLKELKNYKYKDSLRDNNIILAKKMIAASVSNDMMIIQTINAIEDLDKICNVLTKRLREWYGYHLPELEHSIADNEIFARRIIQKSKKEFMEDLQVGFSMGADFSDADLSAMMDFARQVGDLFLQRQKLISYLESVMKEYCPNILEITGAIIAAKLLEKAKSLKNLAFLTSSTIQVLGAEKALFRHLRNKKMRAPKHGFILSHPFVMNSKERGKAARTLAAKISIAAKVDYFKGEYIADKLKKEIE
jgi:RNA processing factor Prp31